MLRRGRFEKQEARDKEEFKKFEPLNDNELNMVIGGMNAIDAMKLKEGDSVTIKNYNSTYNGKTGQVVKVNAITMGGSPLATVYVNVNGVELALNSSQVDKA